jgi:uncharacterized protein
MEISGWGNPGIPASKSHHLPEAPMPTPTPAPIGAFCWPELTTSDLAAAKRFYGPLLGWEAFDVPSAGHAYSLLRVDGLDAAGAMGQPDEAHPHWTAYVKVAEVDTTTAKVIPAGGKVLMEPFDVAGVGRMAVVSDPGGAVLALWQDGPFPGAGVFRHPGALCWVELMTRQPEACTAFYAAILGWEARVRTDMGMPYTIYSHGGRDEAGQMAMAGQIGRASCRERVSNFV